MTSSSEGIYTIYKSDENYILVVTDNNKTSTDTYSYSYLVSDNYLRLTDYGD